MAKLSAQDLFDLWLSVTDPFYTQSLVEAGDGNGLEVFTQQQAQVERVSAAVERTMQAMFILPHSGQTDEPASGGAWAEVDLVFERIFTAYIDEAITFVAGQVLIEEEQTDYQYQSPVGVTVTTGRRYVLLETKTFGPGEMGPITIRAIAEQQGYGYNNPFPNTIKRFVQLGSGFVQGEATVEVTQTSNRITAAPDPDVFIPEHVGQYIVFNAGANDGQVRRIAAFEEASLTAPFNGGVAVLPKTAVINVSAAVLGASLQVGEPLVGATSGATGDFVHYGNGYLVVERVNGTFAAAETIDGIASGSSFTVAAAGVYAQDPELVPESGTAGWQILDWTTDLGFSVTNPASPTGGKAPMLDELGGERRIYRAPNETDELYRQRIARLPDVVSPNAVKRTANKVLQSIGGEVCFREVGDTDGLFPGMFYDVVSTDEKHAYAYDLDAVSRPQDRFKLAMSALESRAFFLLGVPPIYSGDFGIFYDADTSGLTNAYDAFPFDAFFDGYSLTAAEVYRNVWQAVAKVKAGGVGFDLYVEDLGCF